jgi:uncharacterized protein YfaS (alpha-2-macroglobulin family)
MKVKGANSNDCLAPSGPDKRNRSARLIGSWSGALAGMFILAMFVTLWSGAVKAQTIDKASSGKSDGIAIELTEGTNPDSTKNKVAQGAQLSPDRLRELSSLLPPFAKSNDTQAPPVKPPYTRTPPKVEQISAIAFPSRTPEHPASKPVLELEKPLQVIRVSHQGMCEECSELTIQFSQPMVPLSALDASNDVLPAKLNPVVAGAWRWIGTDTLQFQPADGKFPRSTTYHLEIPKGTSSTFGSPLLETFACTFSTPTARLKWVGCEFEDGRSEFLRRPIIMLAFDQRVVAAKVMELLDVMAGKDSVPFRLATEAEVNQNKAISQELAANKNQLLVFLRPVGSLRSHTAYSVRIKPGLSSEEGPDQTQVPLGGKFSTYAAFAMQTGQTNMIETYPGRGMTICFTNRLARAQDVSRCLKIQPTVKNLKIENSAATLYVTGDFIVDKTYLVTVSRRLNDCYGQDLSGSNRLIVKCVRTLPRLAAPVHSYGQILPNKNPSYKIYSWNVGAINVHVYAANADDWAKYIDLKTALGKNAWWTSQKRVQPPGDPFKQVFHELLGQQIDIAVKPESWHESMIDLKPLLPKAKHFIIFVDCLSGLEYQQFAQWVDYGGIGLDAFRDSNALAVIATDIRSGKPVPEAKIRLNPSGLSMSTDERGIAHFDLSSSKQFALQCNVQDQEVILPRREDGTEGWQRDSDSGRFLWYSNTDRNLYRPGEQVHVKGWLRWQPFDESHAVMKAPAASGISYKVTASNGNEIAHGQASLDRDGGFSFPINIPSSVELGSCVAKLTAVHDASMSACEAEESSVTFRIEEFRRPEFALSLNADKERTIVGEPVSFSVTGTYRSGGSLPRSKIHWNVQTSRGYFCPPGWSSFTFGQSWQSDSEEAKNRSFSHMDGVTDSLGVGILNAKCKALGAIAPVTLNTEATFIDVNRQSWSETKTVLIHPASLYAGLKLVPETHYDDTTPEIGCIVTDLDGKPKSTMAKIDVARIVSNGEKTTFVPVMHQYLASGDEAKPVNLKPLDVGYYRVSASIEDDKGRPNYTEVTLSIAKRPKIVPSLPIADPHVVNIKSDKEKYAPGDTAELTIESPFDNAQGIVTIRKFKTDVQSIVFDGKVRTIRIPISKGFYPSVGVFVKLHGPGNAHASGQLNILVPPVQEELTVQVAPAKTKYQPGQTAQVKLKLLDARNNPVIGGQIALAVVDESVLALTGYEWVSPLLHIYLDGGTWTDLTSSTNSVLNPKEALEAANGPGLIGAPVDPRYGQSVEDRLVDSNLFQVWPTVVDERHYTSGRDERHQKSIPSYSYLVLPHPSKQDCAGAPHIKVRSRLDALAYFNPSVRTDGNGSAECSFVLPDSLTGYRIMAVAVKDAQFGNGSSSLTASLPLMVRPSAPRFMNFGDSCELPVVVQNNSAVPVTADVLIRTSNLRVQPGKKVLDAAILLPCADVDGRRIQIPANDRVEVRFPVAATGIGRALLQTAVMANGNSDAAEITFPLRPPQSGEAFATYGQIDEGTIAQKVALPEGVFKQVGGLSIKMSSTSMQQLFDASRYLSEYQFDCSEQLSSRLLGLCAMKDLGDLFGKTLDVQVDDGEKIEASIKLLQSRQLSDGSFGLWSNNEEHGNPFVSIQVTRSLNAARERDFPVDQLVLHKARTFVKENRNWSPDFQTNIAMAAYAAFVRAEMKDVDSVYAHSILAEATAHSEPAKGDLQGAIASSMSLETMCWLLPILSQEPKFADETIALRRCLAGRIAETGSTADVGDDRYGEPGYSLFYSHDRLTANVLYSMIVDQPQNKLIPKLVKSLLLRRVNGRWTNTQDNMSALLAISKYFLTYERQTPKFIAQCWLGKHNYVEQKFVGRSLKVNELKVPMDLLLADKPDLLVLAKEGMGRLYYRLALDYVPSKFMLKEASRGFSVKRTYQALDDQSDVTKDAAGVWHIKAGASVKVKIDVDAKGARHYVALSDPMPAGFESINTSLRGSRKSFDSAAGERRYRPALFEDSWWRRTWFEHENLRDDQAEAFTTLMPSGSYSYSYNVRATTPGTFVAPSCKVEEMYAPETFGRSAAEQVIVE